MLILPNELLYIIFEEVNPLYLINMKSVCKRLNRLCKLIFSKESFRYKLRMEIYHLANSDLNLSLCISSIINTTKIYNQDLIQLIKNIYLLVKNKSLYFGLLGYSVFYFYLYYHPMPTIINLGRMPNVYDDIFVVNLFYYDLDTLKYYLETFLDFKQSEYNTNSYRVKNSSMRYILN